MSSILLWIILAVAIGFIRNLFRNGFPRMPDGRNDTPMGPGGHRRWPPQATADGDGRRAPQSADDPYGRRSPQSTTDKEYQAPRPGTAMTMEGTGRQAMSGRPGNPMSGQYEGRSEYKSKEPVAPTLREPHETVRSTMVEPQESVRETVQVSTKVRPAPEYANEKRAKPASDTERAFSGQSSYDRIGVHPVGRPGRRTSAFFMQKGDLVRAVVMAEILGPPRARNPRLMAGKWRSK